MKGIIDRFEGNYAIVEMPDKKMINIEKIKIPINAKEGTVISISDNGIRIDDSETEQRKRKIEEMMKDIWE